MLQSGLHEGFPVDGVGAYTDALGGSVKEMPLPLLIPFFLVGARRLLLQAFVDLAGAGNFTTANVGGVEVADLVKKNGDEPLLKTPSGSLIRPTHHRAEDLLHDIRCIFVLGQSPPGKVEHERAVQRDKLAPRLLIL